MARAPAGQESRWSARAWLVQPVDEAVQPVEGGLVGAADVFAPLGVAHAAEVEDHGLDGR